MKIIVSKENNMSSLCFCLVLISFIFVANARQIRYNRYNTQVIEDSGEHQNNTNIVDNENVEDDHEVEAWVREVKLETYPIKDFRTSRSFSSTNSTTAKNRRSDIEVTDESAFATTTATIDLTSTTQGYESETTTINLKKDDGERVEGKEDVSEETETSKAPYPPAGFKPKIPFVLPTDKLFKNEEQQQQLMNSSNLVENPSEDISELTDESKFKAPYPAAGSRPSKEFLLPLEQLQLEDLHKKNNNSKGDNSNHPVCGSSTNPLAPKPLEGEKEDPDSEPINVNVQNQQRSQQQ